MGLEKKFDMYIKDLCKKVKNKDVHDSIKLEISDHLHTLKEEAMLAGLSEEEAIDRALAYMGDVEVLGKQLNEIHKARIDLKTAIPVIAVSFLGLLVMYYLQFHSVFTKVQGVEIFNKSLVFYLLGTVFMLSLFTLNYRKLIKYSPHLYIGTVIILALTVLFGVRVDGVPFLTLGFININFTEITPFLLVISFSGIFKAWNWRNSQKFWLGISIILLPIVLLLTTGALSTIIISIIICVAIMHASKASFKQVIGFATVASIWPCLQLLLHSHNYTLVNPFVTKQLYAAGFMGSGLGLNQELISEVHTDFIFAYIIYSFGWFAAIVVCALVGFFIARIISTAKKMNSSYEKILLTGLAATFTTQFILSILTNLGLSPLPGVALPFISFGGSHIILEMIAVGLILSICRRRVIDDSLHLDTEINT